MSDTTGKAIGVVGLGNMGYPMAGRLAERGFAVSVYDIDRSVADRFRETHGGSALEPVELARSIDVLILMLPDGRIVRDFLLSEARGEPVARALRRGSIVVDMSSSAPTGTQQLGLILAEHGVALVDAPVSGGVAGARSGKLAIMTGGDEEVVKGLTPIFDAMAKAIVHVGSLGSGHAMKALNNYVSAAGLLASCEALRVAQHFGIAGERVVEVLNASTGRNNSTENKLGQFVLSEAYNSGFTIGLMHKDLATALDLAKELKIDLPLGDRFVEIWQEAEHALGRNADHTEIVRMVHLLESAASSAQA